MSLHSYVIATPDKELMHFKSGKKAFQIFRWMQEPSAEAKHYLARNLSVGTVVRLIRDDGYFNEFTVHDAARRAQEAK
jgi:hypothetical protein